MRMQPRQMALWSATHDNGWETTAAENVDGTFSAWAAPIDQTVPVDYVEDGPENAKRAADFVLRRKTGHDHCSDKCSGWTLHTHTISVGVPPAEA